MTMITFIVPKENERPVTAMAEYVTKAQVIDWFRPYGHLDKPIPFETLVSDLRGMKAADVEPVRHGQWIKESDGGTRYSVCNKRVRDVTGGWDEPVDLSDMPYRPKCGAKMDEEVNT